MNQAAGRPWPELDGDEVVNYLIMEAVAAKNAAEEKEQREKAEKEAELENWKKDKAALKEAANS